VADPRRPATELMLLMVTGTVCVLLLLFAIGITAIEVTHPESDTGKGIQALSTVISTLLGAILGLLAGRAGHKNQ
jgi:hypothetical protein